MQPTFLPPPNQQQGNNFMNFPNGVSNQQGPPGSGPEGLGLSNQFANIDLNSSGSQGNSHGYGSYPPSNMMAPLPVDPMKFSGPTPPSSGVNSFPQFTPGGLSKPVSQFTPLSAPNSILSNASAPSPLPSNLLGNHHVVQNNPSMPPPRPTSNTAPSFGPPSGGGPPPTSQYIQQSGSNHQGGAPPQSNHNESSPANSNPVLGGINPPSSLPPTFDIAQPQARKSASPQQQLIQPPSNRQNSPQLPPPPSMTPNNQQRMTPNSQLSEDRPSPTNSLQSPDSSRSSAFKPSSGAFQPLKPSQPSFLPTSETSTFPSQLSGVSQPQSGVPQNSEGHPSIRPPVSQDHFTSAPPQGAAFLPPRRNSQPQPQQPQQGNPQQQHQQQQLQQQGNSNFAPQSPSQGQQNSFPQGNQNFPQGNQNFPQGNHNFPQGKQNIPQGNQFSSGSQNFPPSNSNPSTFHLTQGGLPPTSLRSEDFPPRPSQSSTPGPNFSSPPGAVTSPEGFKSPGYPSMQSPGQQQFVGMPPSQGPPQPLSNGFPSPPSMNGPPASSLGAGGPPMSGPPVGSSQLNRQPSGPQPSMNRPPLGAQPSMNGPPSGSFPPTSPPAGPGGRPNLSRPQYARPTPTGYPSQQQQPGAGFPGSQQAPAGFPQTGSQQQSAGFPPGGSQQPPAGFPPLPQQQQYQQQSSGFLGGQQRPGFPASQSPGQPPLKGGFQPQLGAGGFPGSMPGGPSSQKYPAQSPPGFPPQPGVQTPPQPSQYPPGFPSQQPEQGGYPPQSPPGFQPQQDYTGGMQYPNNRPQGVPQKKLDPDNMPSRIQVMEDDRKTRSGEFRTDARGALPPLVTTQFTVQDGGNCSPRYVRSTMYSVPTTPDIMKQVGVPFGIVISPLAKTADGEIEPPEADFSQCGGPVRCARCKAYMAPFMQFVDGGRRFHCPMCKATTEVPETYFAHMDALGQRMDKYQRPELCLGSYDLLVSEEYCRGSKFPSAPALIFVLDVSYSNVKSGLVSLLCSKMLDILSEVTNERLRVGFITYASSVHFYNIKSSLVKPELLEVTDVHEMFMPLLDGFLGCVEEAAPAVQALMSQLPLLFQDTRQTETMLLPAIQAGLEALKANNTSGKLLVFNSSLPIYDAPGKLANREDRKMLGTDKEKTVLTPASQAYNNLGQECVNEGVSVDLFVFNNAYVDLATIGQVARLTGGQIYKYTYFQADIDGERLVEDVRRNIGRPTAFDAVLRVRTSTGIRPTDFYGHMFMSNTTDMEFGSMDSDKAVALELKHDDKLVPEEGVIIQVAFLYTSAHGVRKVRVHNLSLNCTATMADIYRYCELDTLMNFFAKQCSAKICEASPRALRDALITRTASILATYRKHCASPGSSLGQLILPECLKLLPLYVNSLLRCDALSGGPEMSVDDRSFALYCATVMDIPTSVVYLYPHMISLHDLDPALDEMPIQERCSYEKLLPEGAYLIDNSIYMFLWVGGNLSPQWVESVFGVPSVGHIDPDRASLPELPNAISRRVLDIVDYVKSNRPRSMRLTVVRQKDKLEVVLRQFLIEDRGLTEQQMSYVDFLCHIHKEIRNQLS